MKFKSLFVALLATSTILGCSSKVDSTAEEKPAATVSRLSLKKSLRLAQRFPELSEWLVLNVKMNVVLHSQNQKS